MNREGDAMNRGKGVLCAGLDVNAEVEADFLEWHTHEHMPERVGLPGFEVGRRFSRTIGSPRYLIVYEVEDLSVLASPEYVARLNNPTPWTQRVIPAFQNGFRSACTLVCSVGHGEGGAVLVLRLASRNEHASLAGQFETLVEALPRQPGVVRAHLALPDRDTSTTETAESRASGNVFAEEWLLLVEATSEEHLEGLLAAELSPKCLQDHGVHEVAGADIFRLQARIEAAAALS